jgi:Fur family transcriptional regulator, iron response regulator
MAQSRPTLEVAAPAMPTERGPVRSELTGCPWHDVKEKLRQAGLRPTQQRRALVWILFAKGDRHVTAEMLYEEAMRAQISVSLATVYNTLHQFTDAALLRQVAVDAFKTYFDTNNSAHHHFFKREAIEKLARRSQQPHRCHQRVVWTRSAARESQCEGSGT